MRRSVWAELAEQPVERVAAALGMQPGRRRTWPCPACKADRREAARHARGPVGVSRSGLGWRCWRPECEATGDSGDLVAYALTGRRSRDASPEAAEEARAWAVEQGLVAPDLRTPATARAIAYTPPPPPVEQPPHYPSAALLLATRRHLSAVSETWPWWADRRYDDPRRARVAYRIADGGGLFWHIPPAYHLVLPLCDATGATRSYHFRRTDGRSPVKTLNPRGYDVAGLVFLDRVAFGCLSGRKALPTTIICEGVTDYLYACSIAPDDVAVIGGISGSWSALAGMRWRADAVAIVATDPDDAGDRYAAACAAHLDTAGATHRRLRDGEGRDLDAWRPTWSDILALFAP